MSAKVTSDLLRSREMVSFADADLPSKVPGPTLQLFPEQVVRFRNHYRMLAQFAAHVCGTTEEQLTPLHLLLYMQQETRR